MRGKNYQVRQQPTRFMSPYLLACQERILVGESGLRWCLPCYTRGIPKTLSLPWLGLIALSSDCKRALSPLCTDTSVSPAVKPLLGLTAMSSDRKRALSPLCTHTSILPAVKPLLGLTAVSSDWIVKEHLHLCVLTLQFQQLPSLCWV